VAFALKMDAVTMGRSCRALAESRTASVASAWHPAKDTLNVAGSPAEVATPDGGALATSTSDAR
jgi:hypothetical protein